MIIEKVDVVGAVERSIPRALKILAEQVRADSDQYVPRLTGDLRTFVNVNSLDENTAGLIYDSKYASYQWYGIGMSNYTTPGTGPEWCEKARNKYGTDWERVMANGLWK